MNTHGFVEGYPTKLGEKIFETREYVPYLASDAEFGHDIVTIIHGFASMFQDCHKVVHRFITNQGAADTAKTGSSSPFHSGRAASREIRPV
jgi:hypothetical protein